MTPQTQLKKTTAKPKKSACILRPLLLVPGYGWAGMSPEIFRVHMKNSVRKIGKLIKKFNVDAIAFQGSSGSALAFVVASSISIPIMYVRKPKEDSHGKMIECNSTAAIRRYLIVDDFIDSGDTIKRIMHRVTIAAHSRSQEAPECAAIYLYAPKQFSVPQECRTCNGVKVYRR